MYFKQFSRKLSEAVTGVAIEEQQHCNGHLIELTEDGVVLVDKQETKFKALEEARQYIINLKDTKILEETVKTELYNDISDNKIANIIKEHHDVKVTDTLIESYIELASSKLFTIDPVVQDIRDLNRLDRIIEGKIDYKLADGSIVAIDELTQYRLNELLNNQQEIIEYMRESKDNFLHVLKQIGE
jgi:nitrous oxide reductase